MSRVVERAIYDLPADERAKIGAELTRRLIDALDSDQRFSGQDLSDEVSLDPPEQLKAIRRALPYGTAEEMAQPLIPLLDTTLLTNSPGEPNVGHQLLTEIASADRIDLVMAFIRRTGIRPLLEPLRRHVEAGRGLRVLTRRCTLAPLKPM